MQSKVTQRISWRTERLKSDTLRESFEPATILIAESNLGQFARMITDAEFKSTHDQPWFFWMAILDLKHAALGYSKSQAEVYSMLRDLK